MLQGILPIKQTKNRFRSKTAFSTSQEMNGFSVEYLKHNFIQCIRATMARPSCGRLTPGTRGAHPGLMSWNNCLSVCPSPSFSLLLDWQVTALKNSATTSPCCPQSPCLYWSSLAYLQKNCHWGQFLSVRFSKYERICICVHGVATLSSCTGRAGLSRGKTGSSLVKKKLNKNFTKEVMQSTAL